MTAHRVGLSGVIETRRNVDWSMAFAAKRGWPEDPCGWLFPDGNPFPRLRLWRWWPTRKANA